MRNRFTYIAFFAIGLSFIISSYREGPAQSHGWDCTGAETDQNNPRGCTTGSGCHSAAPTAGIAVALQLDSAGVPVNGYKGGQTYTIKIKGVNNTTSTLPAFGFQITCIKGSVAQSTPSNAGTFGTAPASTHIAAPATYYVLDVFEHGTALSPDSGTGATRTVYTDSISWTAPAAGTGTISFWGALNAVNDNGNADAGDLWDTTRLVLAEDTSVTSAIASVEQAGEVKVFPNPVTDQLNLQWQNGGSGTCLINVFDLEGNRIVSSETVVPAGLQSIPASGWVPGIYVVQVEQVGVNRVFRVVKQ